MELERRKLTERERKMLANAFLPSDPKDAYPFAMTLWNQIMGDSSILPHLLELLRKFGIKPEQCAKNAFFHRPLSPDPIVDVEFAEDMVVYEKEDGFSLARIIGHSLKRVAIVSLPSRAVRFVRFSELEGEEFSINVSIPMLIFASYREEAEIHLVADPLFPPLGVSVCPDAGEAQLGWRVEKAFRCEGNHSTDDLAYRILRRQFLPAEASLLSHEEVKGPGLVLHRKKMKIGREKLKNVDIFFAALDGFKSAYFSSSSLAVYD